MKNLAQKRPLLLAFLFFAGFILLLMLPVKAAYEGISGVQADARAELMIAIAKRLVYAAVTAGVLTTAGLKDVFRLPKGGGWFMLTAGVLLITVNLQPEYIEAQAWSSWAGMPLMVLLTIVNCIGVGLFEEFVFRGGVFQLLLKRFGSSRSGTIAAVMASGVLFGLVHLVNLLQHPDLLEDTLLQVAYSAVIGMVFAVMVLRTGSIWGPVVIHALFNLTADLPELMPAALGEGTVLTEFLDIWSIAGYLPLVMLSAIVLLKCASRKTACTI